MSHPSLVITSGEPAGIGPDLCLSLSNKPFDARLWVAGNAELFQQRAKALGLNVDILVRQDISQVTPHLGDGTLQVFDTPLAEPVTSGQLNAKNAPYVINQLCMAAQACQLGIADAIVTAPVQKSVINDAGIPFSGHTEYFAEQTHASLPVMMLATNGLRVALATTHLPLKDVSAAITRESLTQVIDILIADLQSKFAIAKPRILVCGLNPHAGEGGHMGNEEIDTIIPVLEQYKDTQVELIGPLPADTLFTPKYLENADAVLAMYHDQGLPVLKYKGFGDAVNITLGLPIIRTSVDHGTALDLAGSGKADNGSLLVAINTAIDMANASRG